MFKTVYSPSNTLFIMFFIHSMLSCKSLESSKVSSEIFKSDPSYHKSIGVVLAEMPKNGIPIQSSGWGSGFIIGESKNGYIGLTNFHVIDNCLNKVTCFIGFPVHGISATTKWEFSEIEVAKNSMNKPILQEDNRSKNKAFSGDYAAFLVKRKDLKLTPLEVSFTSPPVGSIVKSLGYPKSVLKKNDFLDSPRAPLRLVSTLGVIYERDSSTYHSTAKIRAGSSGGPALIWSGKKFIAFGLNHEASIEGDERAIEVNSFRSSLRALREIRKYSGHDISVIKNKNPKASIWSSVKVDSTVKLPKAKKIGETFSEIKLEATDSKEHETSESGYRVTFKLNREDLTLKKFQFNGIPVAAHENYKEENQTFSFFIPNTNKWLYNTLEYIDLHHESLFGRCFIGEAGMAVFSKFDSKVVDSFFESPNDPKWNSPQYNIIKDWVYNLNDKSPRMLCDI